MNVIQVNKQHSGQIDQQFALKLNKEHGCKWNVYFIRMYRDKRLQPMLKAVMNTKTNIVMLNELCTK